MIVKLRALPARLRGRCPVPAPPRPSSELDVRPRRAIEHHAVVVFCELTSAASSSAGRMVTLLAPYFVALYALEL